MLEQSQVEMSKLTQRNAAITGHLQQFQNQASGLTSEDMRMAYSSALEAQQRLLVMRGQIEKLQSDQSFLEKQIHYFELFQEFQSGKGPGGSRESGPSTSMLETVIEAQESERQRLSRQMHDGPAQALSNFIVQTEIAARLLEIDPLKAKEELDNLKTVAMTTFQKVRNFIFELRPMMLDDLGLLPTIKRYVDAYQEQTGIDATLDIVGKERRLDPMQEVVVFRAIQELMGNAQRHNEGQPGKLKVSVRVILDNNSIKATINDNGKGFDYSEISKDPVDRSKGIGLILIRERVEMLGGGLEVETEAGAGCRITIQMPMIEINSLSQ